MCIRDSYYTGFSNRMVKVFTWLMRLRGQDPKRAGRNKDIDWTRIGIEPGRLHAHIDYRRYWDAKRTAGAAHASQGGGMARGRLLPERIQRRYMATETFIRCLLYTSVAGVELVVLAGRVAVDAGVAAVEPADRPTPVAQ